jgi:hypothetical protein
MEASRSSIRKLASIAMLMDTVSCVTVRATCLANGFAHLSGSMVEHEWDLIDVGLLPSDVVDASSSVTRIWRAGAGVR